MALFNVTVFNEEGTPGTDAGLGGAATRILTSALMAPVSSIIMNSGESPDGVMGKLRKQKADSKDKWLGFNARTNEIGNLKEAGIIDPLKVTKTAFMNAVSVAANYLMIGAAVTEIPEKKEKEAPGMGGMGEY